MYTVLWAVCLDVWFHWLDSQSQAVLTGHVGAIRVVNAPDAHDTRSQSHAVLSHYNVDIQCLVPRPTSLHTEN